MRTRRHCFLAFAIALLCTCGVVRTAHASAPQAAVVHRPVPRYDGRDPPRATAAETLAWVPRILLFPFVLVLEGIRRPTGALLRTQQVRRGLLSIGGVSGEDLVPQRTVRPHVSVIPIATYDHRRRFNLGMAADVAHAFAPRNRLLVTAATGGERFYQAELWDRYRFTRNGSDAGVRVIWDERPDYLVYGRPGSPTFRSGEQYFWMRRVSGLATLSLAFDQHVGAFVSTGLRWTDLAIPNASWWDSTQTPGQDRYGAFVTDAELWLDSRGSVGSSATGARLVGRMHHGVDLAHAVDRRWVTGELIGGAYLEVMHPGRVLGAEIYIAAAQGLGAGGVPFAELPRLGGSAPMRGFIDGRFRGPTASAASLTYRWPIWAWLEAETRLAVGNTFGPGFAGFRPGALAGSWDIAVRSAPGAFAVAEVLVGVGTSPFESPVLTVDQVRVLTSISRSF